MTAAARPDSPYRTPGACLCPAAKVQIGGPSPAKDASADPVQPLLRRTVARSLPLGWDATVTRAGQLCYTCTVGGKRVLRLGQFQWPQAQVQRTVARPLPLDWDAILDPLGQTCYINSGGKIQYNWPEETQPGGNSGVFMAPGSPVAASDPAHKAGTAPPHP